MKDEQFYNKVARKFGDYSSKASFERVFETGDPEAIFKEKLIELGSRDKTALDVGCADGRFTLSMTPHFKQITAIDISDGMLEAAKHKQTEAGITNVEFIIQDANHTTLSDQSFDVVYSRRGPNPYTEAARILKPEGTYMEIEVGEQDTQSIQELFGRGQGFGNWDKRKLPILVQDLEENGFTIKFAEEYLYNEYYKSYADLDLFLQGVPIFKDFDSEKDKEKLEEYVKKYQTERGIPLRRHRIVIVAQK